MAVAACHRLASCCRCRLAPRPSMHHRSNQFGMAPWIKASGTAQRLKHNLSGNNDTRTNITITKNGYAFIFGRECAGALGLRGTLASADRTQWRSGKWKQNQRRRWRSSPLMVRQSSSRRHARICGRKTKQACRTIRTMCASQRMRDKAKKKKEEKKTPDQQLFNPSTNRWLYYTYLSVWYIQYSRPIHISSALRSNRFKWPIMSIIIICCGRCLEFWN